METQKTQITTTIWKKNRARGTMLPWLQTALQSQSNQEYGAGAETQRLMEQNREPRSKPCNDGQLIYNKAGKNTCRKKHTPKCSQHCFTATKDIQEQPRPSHQRQWRITSRQWIFPHREKNRTLPFATWMDLAGTLLSQLGERQILYVITYTGNLKVNHMNITKQKETHKYTENKLVVTSGEMKEEGQDAGREDEEVQTSTCKMNYKAIV